MNTPAIILDKATKQYKGSSKAAVKDLSITIPQGEIYGLLGHNGAGKSTTVMMICGLLHANSGTIKVFGDDPANEGAAVRKRVGVATQDIALFPSLTAMENLQYLSYMYGIKPDKKKLNILLERFGLSDNTGKKIDKYSGGMKRRLNLIASVLHDPALLILDEPTAGVDVQSRAMIMEYLKELNASGMTIIYSSHILEEVERLCHRVGFMSEGVLMEEGKTDDLLVKYNTTSLEAVYLAVAGKSISA
ncbi:MAG: transporter ATP-binding protein [Bacteroidetes bacterium]|nr:transporter ATP-binding protein [Bacteroidota bacterium]